MAESDCAGTLSSSPVCSSSFKMKPVQITYPAASAHQQPRQFRDCDGEIGKCQQPGCPSLPAEMCLSILSFLDAHDLITLSTINHLWNCCCKDESLWKALFSHQSDAQVYAKIKEANWYVQILENYYCTNTNTLPGATPVFGSCKLRRYTNRYFMRILPNVQ